MGRKGFPLTLSTGVVTVVIYMGGLTSPCSMVVLGFHSIYPTVVVMKFTHPINGFINEISPHCTPTDIDIGVPVTTNWSAIVI